MNIHKNSIFLAPDDGGGTGTATAPLAAPIAPATDGGGVIKTIDFDPPGTDRLDYDIMSEPRPKEAPVAKEKSPAEALKPDAKKPEETKKPAAEAKPDRTVGKDEPVANLRKAYDETKGKVATLEQEKAALETKLQEATNNRRAEELEAQIKSKDEQITRAERELSRHSPWANRAVKELEDGFNKEFRALTEFIPDLTGDRLKDLVNRYESLDRTDPSKYREQLAEFTGQIDTDFVGDKQQVLDMIRKGVEFKRRHGELVGKIKDDADGFAFEEHKKAFNEGKTMLHGDLDQVLTVPDDLASTDPHNPVLFIKNVKNVIGEDAFKALDKAARERVQQAILGFEPKRLKDMPGTAPDDFQKMTATEQQQFQKARQHNAKMHYMGELLSALIRPFFKDYSELSARDKARSEANPPDPTAKPGTEGATNGSAKSLKDFDPPEFSERQVMEGSRY